MLNAPRAEYAPESKPAIITCKDGMRGKPRGLGKRDTPCVTEKWDQAAKRQTSRSIDHRGGGIRGLAARRIL